MNKELQKQEAIKRMKMLKICNQTIKEFEIENIVNLSEHGGIKVKTKLETNTGLKLVSSIAGLNGSDLIDYEPKELSNVRQSLKSLQENKKKYEKSLNDLKYQYILNELEKLNSENNSDTTTVNSNLDYEAFRYKLEENIKSNDLNVETETIFSQTEFSSIKTSLLSKSKAYTQFKNQNEGQASGILTKTFSSSYVSEKQSDNLVENLCEYYKNLRTIDDQIIKYEYQLKQLELQVPVHYLYNDELVVYGFGKTYIKNEAGVDVESDVYRLILITNPYENTIFISYNELDTSKIVDVVDSDNNEILFNYNEQNLLSSIVDCKDRKIEFEYSDNQLTKITHPNGEIVKYFYNENKLIYAITENSGLGTKFDYENKKISKISEISVLNCIKNGQIQYIFENFDENCSLTTLNQLESENRLLSGKSLSFDYYDYKSTTLTDNKGNSKTYVLNRYGNTMCEYTNKFNEDESSNTVEAKQYNYTNDKVSETISALPYSTNYLHNVCFDAPNMTTEYGYYLGDDIYLGEEAIPYSYQVCKNYHSLPNIDGVLTACVNVPSDQIEKIKEDNIYFLVLSGWAKADSAFVFDTEDRTTDNTDYANSTDEIKNRRFGIKADVTYIDGTTDSFSKSFDWMNTEWQYCALPISIDQTKTVQSIACHIDYTNNTGEIKFTDLELRESSWTKTEYKDKLPCKTYSSHAGVVTTYAYKNEKLVKEVATYNGQSYTTTYEYNKNGKLLRKIDYNGIVSENVYNNKGMCIKTKTYHKDDPTTVFYQESELDEKGNQTGELNELGEKVGTYEYDSAGIVTGYTDTHGNKTAYGYNKADTLLSMTHSVGGEPNSNLFGYTGSYLTSLKHNGFEIGYEYDNLGRTSKIKVADSEYLSKTYANNEETIVYATGEKYRQVFNDDGNIVETYYTATPTEEIPNPKELMVIQNIYNTHGDLIASKDIISGNNQKIDIDKFGNRESGKFTT